MVFFIKKKSPLVFPFSFVKRNLFAISLLDPLYPKGASVSPRTPKGSVSPLPRGLRAYESGGPPSPQGHWMALRWGVRRESCFISPGVGVGFPAPKDRILGFWPQEAHPEDSGVSGHFSKPPAAIPLLPFPQGLGSHHSGLRTIKDWEPGGWASPKCAPLQAPFGQEGPRTLGSPGGL